MIEPPRLKTPLDYIEQAKRQGEWREWLDVFHDAQDTLGSFVASRRPGSGSPEYVHFYAGALNVVNRYKFDDDGPDAIIRFPSPGSICTALRDEKVVNEVRFMEFLAQNTTIPIPRILSWGLTAESPHQLGPFIIMDYVEGVLLSKLLKRPTMSPEMFVLNPDIKKAVLDKVYYKIAEYMLQLSRISFNRIGAISRDGDPKSWCVKQRPLTWSMNEMAAKAGYPNDKLHASAFDTVAGYLQSLARGHMIHLKTQRNLAADQEVARARFITRHRLAKLIPKYSIDDSGPFIPFGCDFGPSDLLVDPKTFKITAFIDFEFTNAMPAQFSYDPPWWLLLAPPGHWLDHGRVDEFKRLYEPRMHQFIQALERVEDAQSQKEGQPTFGGPRLSARMRDSWNTGRFWFNLAIRDSFEADVIYWSMLRGDDEGGDFLDDETQAEMHEVVQSKMEQLAAYEAEEAAHLPGE